MAANLIKPDRHYDLEFIVAIKISVPRSVGSAIFTCYTVDFSTYFRLVSCHSDPVFRRIFLKFRLSSDASVL
jgi:hypothetical protein